MKGLVIAAGMGERLGDLTKNINKCALDINGTPMIKRIIDGFKQNSINDLYVTTGYMVESIKEVLQDTVSYIHNPIYHATGVLVSTWVARERLSGQEFIWSTGDNLFDPIVIKDFVNAPGDIVVAVKIKDNFSGREVRTHIINGDIISFDQISTNADAEFSCMAKFNANASSAFFKAIQHYLSNQETKVQFIECLMYLREQGFRLVPFFISADKHAEVDTLEDLKLAQKTVANFEIKKNFNRFKVTEEIFSMDTGQNISNPKFSAVILAAGVGKRLQELTKFRNKASIKIGGRSMIRRVVDTFKKNNINDIHIVTGYHENLIIGEIGNDANYIHNPLYRSVGILLSLWMTREKIKDKAFILSTADYVSDPTIFTKFLQSTGDVVVAVRKKECSVNDVKVTLKDGFVEKLERDLPIHNTVGEFAMMIKFSSNGTHRFLEITKNYLTQQKHDTRLIDVLNTMIMEGSDITPFFLEEHQGLEVDTFEDLEKAENMVSNFDNQTLEKPKIRIINSLENEPTSNSLDLTELENIYEYLKINNLFQEEDFTVNFMNVGNINYVYEIESKKAKHYLKYFPDTPRRNTETIQKIGYTAERFDTEVGALELLRDKISQDLVDSIPKITHISKSNRVLIVSDVARNGEFLKEYLLTNFEVDKIKKVIEKVAILTAQQHSQTHGQNNFKPYFNEDPEFNRRFYDFRTLVSCEKLPDYEQSLIQKKAHEIYTENEKQHAVLINNDLSPKQIFVRPDNSIGICDFEIMARGVASYDIGFFLANILIIQTIRADYKEDIENLIQHFTNTYFNELKKQGTNQDFIDFTFKHLGFFIGTGMLNRIDAVPLEPHIPESKIQEIRLIGVDYIFDRKNLLED